MVPKLCAAVPDVYMQTHRGAMEGVWWPVLSGAPRYWHLSGHNHFGSCKNSTRSKMAMPRRARKRLPQKKNSKTMVNLGTPATLCKCMHQCLPLSPLFATFSFISLPIVASSDIDCKLFVGRRLVFLNACSRNVSCRLMVLYRNTQ